MHMRIVALTLLTLGAAPVAAQKVTGTDASATPPAPVALKTDGLFLEKYVRIGDDLFIAGQPTERALRELRAQGVTTVINLRSPAEMTRDVTFDEAAVVGALGMSYVHLPMRGTPDLPYAPTAVKDFARAITSAKGKVLLHCTIAWRASHLWAAYLVQELAVPPDTALAHARAINLMDDHRMDGDRHPIELFLGRTVPGLRRPPQL